MTKGNSRPEPSTEGNAPDPPAGSDGESPESEPESGAASDAFQALGNEHRTEILRTLAADGPSEFSALVEASDVDTSAGFAYHLRELTDRFVRQRPDDRYELTAAGRRAASAMRARAYTDSVDRAPVALEEACPLCGRAELAVAVADSVTEVACRSCETAILALSMPPGGYTSHDAESLPAACDAYHRRRIATFAEGFCPDCGGAVDTAPERRDGVRDDGNAADLVQLSFDCTVCEASLRSPVTLAVLDHPAVVAFYRDHGESIADRPVWNVGPEWRERVVSRDPWCVVVSTRLDGDELRLYVAGDGRVVDHRRTDADDDSPERGQSSPDRTEQVADDAGRTRDPGESGESATEASV